MNELSLRILFKILFEIDISAKEAKIVAAAKDLNAKFNMSSVSSVLPTWIPTKTNRNYRRAMRKLEAEIGALLRERERNDDDSDTVTILSGTANNESTDITEKSVRNELLDFLLEHNTIGLNMAYTLHLLASNPESLSPDDTNNFHPASSDYTKY